MYAGVILAAAVVTAYVAVFDVGAVLSALYPIAVQPFPKFVIDGAGALTAVIYPVVLYGLYICSTAVGFVTQSTPELNWILLLNIAYNLTIPLFVSVKLFTL